MGYIRKGIAQLAAIFLFCTLISCAAQQNAITNDIIFLTSNETAGRLPGTTGNEMARDYIAKQFEKAGLDFYDEANSYFEDYEQETYNPTEQTQVLEVTFLDGTKEDYYAGIDIPCILDKTAAGISGRMTSDPKDPAIAEKIFLQENREGIDLPEKCRGIIQQSDRLNAYTMNKDIPTVQIPTKIFREIQESGVSVKINGELLYEKENVQNVVGVKRGQKGKNAIVIGAHFDHVGSYGDTIYSGALDNASGTAVLLDLVRQTSNETFPILESDLIFCAFNGEESLMQGSRAFVNTLSKYDVVNMLNIDCVGAPTVGALIVEQDGNMELTEKLNAFLQEKGIACKRGTGGASDYMSFTSLGYPATGLATENESESTHIIKDTIEQIDCEELERLASVLPDFLALLDKDLVPVMRPDSERMGEYHITFQDIPPEIQEEAKEEGRRLVKEYQVEYDERIYFPYKGFYFSTSGNYPIPTPQEVQKRYPELAIPKNLNDFVFKWFREPYADGMAILDEEDPKELPNEPTVKKSGVTNEIPKSFTLVYQKNNSGFVISVTNTAVKRVLISEDEEQMEYPSWETHSECSIQPAPDNSEQVRVLQVPGLEGTSYKYWVMKFKAEENSNFEEHPLVNMTEEELEEVYQAIREVLEPTLNENG